jgi:integrase/recombinase XerD
MPGKQAKVVTPPMLKRMLRHVSRSSFPARDRAMVLLSVKAGLRACEIAGLDWSMVLDAQGRVSGTIHVRDVIAKKRGGRRIPMHPDLRRALEKLARTVEPVGPVICSYRGGHLKANSVVNWFVALFQELGFETARRIPVGAVSSPSPPATFIARAVVYATCNCSRGIGPSKPLNATSMATPARSGDWWRTFRGKIEQSINRSTSWQLEARCSVGR